MAEALVSVVLQQLASITLEQIEEEVNLVVGVDQEVQNLILHLQAVQGLLQDAEERQVKEANVKNWLYNLKDASYQINDVLDEWNTAILKHHMEKQEKEGENNDLVHAKRNKVRFSIPSFLGNILICFGEIGNGIIMRHDIAKRIKEINERLTWIAILRNNYNFQSTVRGTEQVERSKTTSFVDVSTIIGREEEKKEIIRTLKSESGDQLVIPIVGMGGLGKTAFAQSVYNDQNVTTHFHERIWVCVSDPFEEIKIAQAIIEVLKKDDDRKNSNVFQILLSCISENIRDKKFLLILDDVWNPTESNWKQLKAALKNGDQNSRILVTTRKNNVANMMGETNDHMINLNKLSDRDCLELFRRIAFFDKEIDETKLFDEDIKTKIAKKVDGLPLAAKTLASLMRYKKTRKEWVAVLESKMWELEEVEQQVFQSLLLSYYDLTPAVRQCLLFCAVFPKDYKFDRNELIECWMSQEYLSMKGDREKERMIGQQYFDNLVMRSFFQDFVKDENDDIKECKMHDIVHDFVQFLTKNECFIMEVVESGKEKNMVVDNKVRHLNIMSTYNDSFPVSIYNCKGLRTLVISTSELLPLPSDSFSKLKSIRTLKLKRNSIKEVPESIGGLVHLRYLDLSQNWELELPNSVGNLFNLETLQRFLQSQLKNLVTLWFSLAVLFLHAVTSWVLVYELDFGVVGAAMALDISWWVWGLGLFWYVSSGRCPHSWAGFSMQAFSGLWAFVKFSAASGSMRCLEFWSYRILILMTGSLEKATLAVDALTICMTISGWELMIHWAFLVGTGVRVANELGAGNWKATKFAAKVSMAESVFIGLCICIITIILHDKFAYIFTSSTDVIQEVGQMSYLLAMAILLNSIQPVLTGIVVGTGLQAWVAYINLFC